MVSPCLNLKLAQIPRCLDLTLFSYLTWLVELPASRLILGTLNNHEALDFKKRWIAYELDQRNQHAHLPVVEFFLRHGIKMLPPEQGKVGLEDRIESIDREEVAKTLAKAGISACSWVVDQSIFESGWLISFRRE